MLFKITLNNYSINSKLKVKINVVLVLYLGFKLDA